MTNASLGDEMPMDSNNADAVVSSDHHNVLVGSMTSSKRITPVSSAQFLRQTRKKREPKKKKPKQKSKGKSKGNATPSVAAPPPVVKVAVPCDPPVVDRSSKNKDGIKTKKGSKTKDGSKAKDEKKKKRRTVRELKKSKSGGKSKSGSSDVSARPQPALMFHLLALLIKLTMALVAS
jgi:hypothetical protein